MENKKAIVLGLFLHWVVREGLTEKVTCRSRRTKVAPLAQVREEAAMSVKVLRQEDT